MGLMMDTAKLEILEKFFLKSNVCSSQKKTPALIITDEEFCQTFFKSDMVDNDFVAMLLKEAIENKDATELDLILMLIEHFTAEQQHQLEMAKLLLSSWHSMHDRIAGLLNNQPSDEIVYYLYRGATFRCDNLDYESDYCEFNRKCLYALAKNGSGKSKEYIKLVSQLENKIIANHALKIMDEFNI